MYVVHAGTEDEPRDTATVHDRLHRQLYGHRLPEDADRVGSAVGAPLRSCAGTSHPTGGWMGDEVDWLTGQLIY